jgi:predicted permease
MGLLNRVTGLFKRTWLERGLNEELQHHIELKTQEYIEAGMSPEEARYAALQSFGGVEQKKEECRDADRLPWIDDLIQDVRFGLRQLRRNPGFTVVAVITLALGIAANLIFFTAIDDLFLRPPTNVETPQRLVSLYQTRTRQNTTNYMPVWSNPDYSYYRDHNTVFSGLAAYSPAPVTVETNAATQRMFADLVTGNYFGVLGIKPFLGREIMPADEFASPLVAVIRYSVWKSLLGAERNVVGKDLSINGHLFTIIGVAPQGTTDIGLETAPAVWLPLTAGAEISWPPDSPHALSDRGTGWLTVFGRLKPGIATRAALSNLRLVAQHLDDDYPSQEQLRGIALEAGTALPPFIRDQAVGFIALMQILAGLLLLIPCANVGSLMLARAVQRRREVTIRFAVGASRRRIIRQLLTESTLLGVFSGALGLLLGTWVMYGLAYFKPPISLPINFALRPDIRVFGFTLLLAVVTVLLFGMAPALRAAAGDLAPRLGGRSDSGVQRRSRAHHVLIVGQIAISILLLLGAGLCFRSLNAEQRVKPGFRVHHVLGFNLSPTLSGYSRARASAFYKELLERLSVVHGVRSVALASLMPLSYGQMQTLVRLGEGSSGFSQPITVRENFVGTSYFDTIGIPILEGRAFAQGTGDKDGVVINQTLAHRFFRRQDPIGRYLRLGGGPNPRSVEIIGVVRDSKYRTLSEAAQPFLYELLTPGFEGPSGTTVLLRTSLPASSLVTDIRAQVRALDKSLPMSPIETMQEHLRAALWPPRMIARLLGSLGLVGMLLAMIGLYGNVAHSVISRTHEIGVRVALGAQRADVLKVFVGQGLRLTLIGVSIGLLAALGLTRFLSNLLYAIKPTDPVTFVGVTLILTAVALLASYIPARRAANVDPMVALRYE